MSQQPTNESVARKRKRQELNEPSQVSSLTTSDQTPESSPTAGPMEVSLSGSGVNEAKRKLPKKSSGLDAREKRERREKVSPAHNVLSTLFNIQARQERVPEKEKQLQAYDNFIHQTLSAVIPDLSHAENLCNRLDPALIAKLSEQITHRSVDMVLAVKSKKSPAASKEGQPYKIINPYILKIQANQFIDLTSSSPYPCLSAEMLTFPQVVETESRNVVYLTKHMEGESIGRLTVRWFNFKTDQFVDTNIEQDQIENVLRAFENYRGNKDPVLGLTELLRVSLGMQMRGVRGLSELRLWNLIAHWQNTHTATYTLDETRSMEQLAAVWGAEHARKIYTFLTTSPTHKQTSALEVSSSSSSSSSSASSKPRSSSSSSSSSASLKPSSSSSSSSSSASSSTYQAATSLLLLREAAPATAKPLSSLSDDYPSSSSSSSSAATGLEHKRAEVALPSVKVEVAAPFRSIWNHLVTPAEKPKINYAVKDEAGNNFLHLLAQKPELFSYINLDQLQDHSFINLLGEENHAGKTPMIMALENKNLSFLKRMKAIFLFKASELEAVMSDPFMPQQLLPQVSNLAVFYCSSAAELDRCINLISPPMLALPTTQRLSFWSPTVARESEEATASASALQKPGQN